LPKDAKENFSLQGKKHDLSKGRLFLIDFSAATPRIEQVRRDLQKITAEKQSCVAVLTELAANSGVAKSLLEELASR